MAFSETLFEAPEGIFAGQPPATLPFPSLGGGGVTYNQAETPDAPKPGDTWLRSATDHTQTNAFGQSLLVRSSDNTAWVPVSTVRYYDNGHMSGFITIGNDGAIAMESFNSDGSCRSTMVLGQDMQLWNGSMRINSGGLYLGGSNALYDDSGLNWGDDTVALGQGVRTTDDVTFAALTVDPNGTSNLINANGSNDASLSWGSAAAYGTPLGSLNSDGSAGFLGGAVTIGVGSAESDGISVSDYSFNPTSKINRDGSASFASGSCLIDAAAGSGTFGNGDAVISNADGTGSSFANGIVVIDEVGNLIVNNNGAIDVTGNIYNNTGTSINLDGSIIITTGVTQLYPDGSASFAGGLAGFDAYGNLTAANFSDGGGGNPFDQNLNTSDDVSFSSIECGSINGNGILTTGYVQAYSISAVSSDVPPNAAEGTMYWNTTTHALKVYDGSAWKTVTLT